MTRDSVDPVKSDRAGETGLVKVAGSLVIATIIVGALYLGQTVLMPLAIAFLIGFALNPLVTFMSRRGVPRVLSVILVMLTFAIALTALGFLVASQVRMLSAELPTYQSTIRQKISDLRESFQAPGIFEGALETIDTVQEEVSKVEEPAEEEVPAPSQRVELVPPAKTQVELAVEWLAPALAPVATAGIVLVFVFLVLLDRGDLRDRLIRLLGGNLHRSTDAMEEAGKRISKYLLMQLVVNVSYGVPMAAGLWFIGVPGWLLWGTLAALMRFVPYIGPLLSAVFPIALAFAVDPGWDMVLWTVALIIVLELISNNIIEPLLYGTSTGLSAMSLIVAATFWTALWGPIGLILSTPLTVCLLVLGKSNPQFGFFDTLLGSTPVLDAPTRIYQRLIADDSEEAMEIAYETIEDEDVVGFYSEHCIEVLRKVSDDYLTHARPEHRLRIANGMDELLDDLREEYPAPEMNEAEPRIACIGGKWEIDSVACEMIVHALAREGLSAVLRREGVVTARYASKLDLDGIDIVCISYFSREPASAARTFCRRLRQHWPECKIVLALWSAPPDLLEPAAAKVLGADEIVVTIEEAVLRMKRLIAPEEIRELQMAEAPDNDRERVQALQATGVLEGHAREDLDSLAKRAADVFDVKFAVISAIDATDEYIIGQSIELPGARDSQGRITMPREEAVCDHVVSGGEMLVIEDTRRDPRFVDHPAITLWDTRFYAGAPLKTAGGMVLGALCLLDTEPREFKEEDLALLDTMAADAVSVITGEETVEPDSRKRSDSPSSTVAQKVPD